MKVPNLRVGFESAETSVSVYFRVIIHIYPNTIILIVTMSNNLEYLLSDSDIQV